MLLLRLHTRSDPQRLTDARQQVREVMMRAGLSAPTARDMELAVGEVLSNVHRHAYQDGVGPVLVIVFRSPSAVSALVSDRGNATWPPLVPRLLPARSTGRGLFLASCLADEVMIRVNTTGHGLAIRMTKRHRLAA